MGDLFMSTLSDLTKNLPFASRTIRCRKDILSKVYEKQLHRVKVLEGHTGCVNALSWAKNDTLISGGDDTTVRLWQMSQAQNYDDLEQTYPFSCKMEVSTGHTENIFAAQMLPFSSRIVTVAKDKQIRMFDIENLRTNGNHSPVSEITYDASPSCSVIRCHSGAVKRIVTETSPDQFLTVSEDGTVRQHDLRGPPHHCSRSGGCPTPLVKLRHSLYSLSLSPMAPYQLVVAGDAPHGYLFDRRQLGRFLEAEWGMPVESDHTTTCVRRFARRKKNGRNWRNYITGAKMSESASEVILSYAGDSVYLFSTRDEPVATGFRSSPTMVASNAKRRKTESASEENDRMDIDEGEPVQTSEGRRGEEIEEDEEDEDEDEEEESSPQSNVPLILPKLRYSGISNVRTIKDANFLGPDDKFVVSGSEDGNFFVWRRLTGALHGIYEGDGSVVNVIEGHPDLPLVAVSGIDTTVKLFSPAEGSSKSSRIDNAAAIMARNSESISTPRFSVQSLLQNYSILLRSSSDEEMEERCNFQ